MKDKGLLIAVLALSISCAALFVLLATRPIEYREAEARYTRVDLGGGRYIEAEPGSAVLIEGDIEDFSTAAVTTRTDEARGRGVGVSERGASKLAMSMDFGSPETGIAGGASSVAGYANVGIKAMFDNGAVTLYIISGGAIILGFVLGFWLKAWKIGIGFIVGGVAMFAVVKFFTAYPWVLWILILAALAVGGFLLWDYWKKRRDGQAGDAIIAGIEGLPDSLKRIVTKLVGAEAMARGTAAATKKAVGEHKANGATPRVDVDISKDVEVALKEYGSG